MSGASFASEASGTCDSRGRGGVRGAANAAGNMAPPEVPPTPRRIQSAAGRKVVGPSACRGGAGQAQKRAPGTRVRCHSGAAGRREAGVSRTAAARSSQECLVKGQVFSRSALGFCPTDTPGTRTRAFVAVSLVPGKDRQHRCKHRQREGDGENRSRVRRVRSQRRYAKAEGVAARC